VLGRLCPVEAGECRWGLASIVALIGGAWLIGPPAEASLLSPPIIVPCSGANSGPAGLVSAVNKANQSGGGTIILTAGCTYQLTAPAVTGANGPDGLPPITTNVTIEGNGDTVSGNGCIGCSNNYRILEVGASGTLTAVGLTIQGGNASVGGGILNDGTTTLTGVTLRNNTGPQGGGIANRGHLSMVGSTLTNDGYPTPAGTSDMGGGIYNSGQATVALSMISGNFDQYGGGIANSGQLSIADSEVMSNFAITAPTSHNTSFGAGLYTAGGSATLIATAVTSNAAGGTDASSQGFGGGVYDSSGTVTLVGGVVANNTPDNCEPAGTVAGCVG